MLFIIVLDLLCVKTIVLKLLNVFILSYGIAKCVREIIRESVMWRDLTTNELI